MRRFPCALVATTVLLSSLALPVLAVDNLITNGEFDGPPIGDAWMYSGNVDFNNFFGADVHASLYADTAGNLGIVTHDPIACGPNVTYTLQILDMRLESSWDATLQMGFDFLAANGTTVIGGDLVTLDAATRVSNGQVDGNVFSVDITTNANTAFVSPFVFFFDVNPTYIEQAQANGFVFDTFLNAQLVPGEQYLKNPDFADVKADGAVGDYWSSYGAAGFHAFFGPDNPHASLFADSIANVGGVYQPSIAGTPGAWYEFRLDDVRVEENFDGELHFGLEFYDADNFTKLGEAIELIDTSVTGDGLSYRMVGQAAAGTAFVRPIISFDHVQTDGGSQRNVFVFASSLTQVEPGVNILKNPGFAGTPLGIGWGAFGNAGFNDFFGGNTHASLFADTAGNSGGVFQVGIPVIDGRPYEFALRNARIEASWDADLLFGLEYFAADDSTKLGESLFTADTAARQANAVVDGNVFVMQATPVAGAAYVRPIVRFDNVNPAYAAAADASAFVFDAYMGLAPQPGDEYLKNPGFADIDGNGDVGDYWGVFGNAGLNEFFGPNNGHASLFADTVGNSGGVFQQGILATPGAQYQFDLNDVRIENSFDAELYFGLEYYGDDDFTKLGEDIQQIVSAPGDGLTFSMTGTVVGGTKYVRPVVSFNNVATTGADHSVFVFDASLSQISAPVPGDWNNDGMVTVADYGALASTCMQGPGVVPANADCLTVFDFDTDSDVDLEDASVFLGLAGP